MSIENKNSEKKPQSSGMILVQLEDFRRLEEKQDEILNLLKGNNHPSSVTDDFLTEDKAKEIFPRGSTWFWNKRKSGELPFSKVGQTVYYKREDLLKLINSGIL